MIKIVHVITDLSVGGAQNMLLKLLRQTDRNEFDPVVISLKDAGVVGEAISSLGITVLSCNMTPEAPDPAVVMRLARILKELRPHLVQTWMYHSDLIGGIANKMAGSATLAWNIRHSQLDPATVKRSTILIGKICAKMSGVLPDRILCCSEVAKEVHLQLGYNRPKFHVIPNGFELAEYRPDIARRANIREELGISEEALVIGHVGRYHPMKDHRSFVRAAKSLSSRMDNVYYVLCGDDVDWNNEELSMWIRSADLESRFRLLGRRSDLPSVNAALDIATLCSTYGEGFPNVVGEAMACAIPCVVTNVGDSAYIVGDTGTVIEPGNPDALGHAWFDMLTLDNDKRKALGALARERMETKFDIAAVVKQYQNLYRELVNAH